MRLKKTLLLAAGITCMTTVLAQPAVRTSAYYAYQDWAKEEDKASEDAKKDILEAKKLIDECYNYSDDKFVGKKDAKTLYYRGKILMSFQFYATDADMKDMNPIMLVAEGMKMYKEHIDLPNKKSRDDKTDEIRQEIGTMRQMANLQAQELYKKGDEALQQRKDDEAKKYFNQAMMGYNGAAELMKLIGEVDTVMYYSAGLAGYYAQNYKGAAGNFKVCSETGFGVPQTHNLYAECLLNSGNEEEGLAVLAKAAKEFPQDPNVYITEGNYWLSQEKNEKAAAAYDKAIQADPKNETVYYTTGTVNFSSGNYDAAEKYFLKAIELKPDYIDALYNLGATYYNKGAQMTKDFEQNFTNATMNPEQQKEVDDVIKKAIPHLEKVRETEPNDRATLMLLYKVYEALKMSDKSKEIEEILFN